MYLTPASAVVMLSTRSGLELVRIDRNEEKLGETSTVAARYMVPGRDMEMIGYEESLFWLSDYSLCAFAFWGIEEVFKNLRCSKDGLSSEAAEERLTIFGHNKLEEKQESKFFKFLGFMWNPLSWVMEAAAIMAIALANGGGKPPDWQDFVGIITLLVINSTISFIEENNAGNAAAALMARLAPKAKVLRDGRWNEQDAAVLVPGDIISIKLGDIVPADARLLEGDPLKIDQV